MKGQPPAMPDSPSQRYARSEELANSITHGIGVVLSIAALAVLVSFAALRGDAWRIVSFSIYGTTLFLLYLASTLYHSFRSHGIKQLFRVFDHAAIFLLIAGTYTPIALVTLRGAWGWTIFGLIWGLAIVGVALTVLSIEGTSVVTMLLYVGMGWLVVIAIKPLVVALPKAGLVWMALGGVLYSLGIGFYAWKRLPYNHAIWHLFVLGGSVCHFFGILFYVLPTGSS